MKIKAIKTRLVRAGEISLEDLLSESIKTLPENSVVAISSKIVSLCENNVIAIGSIDKEELIRREADYYMDRGFSPYGYHFAIKHNTLISMAGIDESNGDGNYVLWPSDPFKTANTARKFLCEKFNRKNIGVIITDSSCYMMRRGTIGIALAWSGFEALNDWRGRPDLFGRDFVASASSIVMGLAVAANIVMGEGSESTPLAIISDVPFVKFTHRDPTESEIARTLIDRDEDIFAPFLTSAPWREGGGKKSEDT
jgi:F420-0:gamma-glutamyl ligase